MRARGGFIIAILLQTLLFLPALSDFLYFTMSSSTILQTKGLTSWTKELLMLSPIIVGIFKWYHSYLTVLQYSFKVEDILTALFSYVASCKRKYLGNMYHHSLAKDNSVVVFGSQMMQAKTVFDDDSITLIPVL